MSKKGFDSKKDVINMSGEELLKKKVFLKKELFNLRFQGSLEGVRDTSRFKYIRKDIARINTEITKRKSV